MIKVRSFTSEGTQTFRTWITAGAPSDGVDHLISAPALSTPFQDCTIDQSRIFASRFEFGSYLLDIFSGLDTAQLLARESDGLWAWISALYFRQLALKGIRRAEHYIPTREGFAGSLLHRHAARTAFELVLIHGQNAQFALQQPMHTHGQLLESLSASQTIVRNKGFFAAAAKLYVKEDGSLKRGATSKPKKPKMRKPGDEAGKGSIRRLPIALKRLDLTYDVEVLSPSDLISLLPKEYSRWTRSADSSRQ